MNALYSVALNGIVGESVRILKETPWCVSV
jgi:hypothetical protein